MTTEMARDHVRMTTARVAVLRRPTEHLGDEPRDVCRVISRHIREHRREQRISMHTLVEVLGQLLQRSHSTGPLIQRRNGVFLLGHGTFPDRSPPARRGPIASASRLRNMKRCRRSAGTLWVYFA